MPIEMKTYDDITCQITKRYCCGLYCEEYKTCDNPKVIERRDRLVKRRMGR
jgi:hypothetical protein